MQGLVNVAEEMARIRIRLRVRIRVLPRAARAAWKRPNAYANAMPSTSIPSSPPASRLPRGRRRPSLDYPSSSGGNSASMTSTASVMNMTEDVVALPTPSAPPCVRKPMCVEIMGIAKPNASPLASE